MQSTIRRKRGFTLIELLVVIAIIAILAAILFPVFVSAKEKGRQMSCIGNMRQLATGFKAYLTDYSKYPGGAPLHRANLWPANQVCPEYAKCRSSDPNENSMDIRNGCLFRYVKNTEVYICVSDYHARKLHGRGVSAFPFGLSYSMNAYLDWEMSHTDGTRGTTEGSVRRPTKCVVLLCEGASDRNGGYGTVDGYFGYGNDRPTLVHVGGTTFSFADGHVAPVLQSQWDSLIYEPTAFRAKQ